MHQRSGRTYASIDLTVESLDEVAVGVLMLGVDEVGGLAGARKDGSSQDILRCCGIAEDCDVVYREEQRDSGKEDGAKEGNGLLEGGAF